MQLVNQVYDQSKAPNEVGADSFASMIVRLMPNGQAPLFGLTSMMGTETASQVLHGYFSKTMVFPSCVSNAGTATTTTLTVGSTATILPGMILQTASLENLLVLTVPSATSITVSREFGTVAAAAISASELLVQVGNAQKEGSTKPQAMSIAPVRITNLTQIFRNHWSISGTVEATAVIAGDGHIAENKSDCSAFHASDIEKAIFFGQRKEVIIDQKPVRAMDGIISTTTALAPANIFTAGTTTNATELEEMLDVVFEQTTDPKHAPTRLLFVGNVALRVINNICKLNATYHIKDGETNWGLQFKTFTTARGTFDIITHPLFTTNPVWSKMAVAVDLPTLRLAYLQGRKTSHKSYSSTDGSATDDSVDASGGTLLSELTSLCKNPSANAVIYGLTAASIG